MANTKISRNLHGWEIQEFSPIFENSINWDRVRVVEHDPLPDRIDRIGRFFKRMKPPKTGQHNAITFGNKCIFPIGMPALLLSTADREAYKHPWLLHEITHAWQFQHMGWPYLFKALWAQAKYGSDVYNYGGAQGLIDHRAKGLTLFDFNLEQQAHIIEDYYARLRRGMTVDAYLPYIDDIRSLK